MKANNIVFYVEEELDQAVFKHAVQVANKAHAKITLLTVISSSKGFLPFSIPGYPQDEIERVFANERYQQLENSIAAFKNETKIAIQVLMGDPLDEIFDAVKANDFDFLIKSPSPNHNLRQHLFGCIDMHLMRFCPCPVFIARTMPDTYTGKAIAAVSYEAGNKDIVRLNHDIIKSAAFAQTTHLGGINEIYIAHAWEMYGESMLESGHLKLSEKEFEDGLKQVEDQHRQWLTKLIDDCKSDMEPAIAADFNPKLTLLHGNPKITIPELVKHINAEVLALGTLSRKGLKGQILGNTSEEILNRVNCSVVTHNLQSL